MQSDFKAFSAELNSLVHKNIARTIGVVPATKTSGPVVVSEPLPQTLRVFYNDFDIILTRVMTSTSF